MMLELVEMMNKPNVKCLHATYQSILFPEPAEKQWSIQSSDAFEGKSESRIRFPWTHKRGPVTCQSLNELPWVNHVAVPRWCCLSAILWFVEGSGG